MEFQKRSNRAIAIAWRKAWSNRVFRIKTIVATIVFLSILIAFPFFFSLIEKRQGSLLHDPLLAVLPAIDVSVITFITIWSMIILFVVRCIQDPNIFIVGFCSMILLFLSRMVTISLFPLEPPVGLIPLVDPLASIFYGGPHVFMTKDLFYSGHTSTQVMIFLCLPKKTDKRLALASAILIGAFVLIQHVHYSIDVIGAFVFPYFVYLLGKRVAKY
jgi:hypothetical protein